MENTRTTQPLTILFLAGSRTDPASRFRVCQFEEPLRALGHRVTTRIPYPPRTWTSGLRATPGKRIHSAAAAAWRVGSVLWNLRDAPRFDVILMNRDLVPEPWVNSLEPWLAKRNPRLIFDFDDAIHLGAREAKLRRILPWFAWVTPGNPYLAGFAEQLNKNVTIWPTVVDTAAYQPLSARREGPLRIGWSGSTSTARYCLPLLQAPLTELAKLETFEFIIICDSDPQVHWPGVTTRFVKWTPKTEVQGLQELDLGLMPLKDEPFERGKCGLKAIQYMGVGVPALVSPVGVNQTIVADGVTGFHCAKTSDWVGRLRTLLADHGLRRSMAAAARSRTVEHYSVAALLPQMLSLFRRVATTAPRHAPAQS